MKFFTFNRQADSAVFVEKSLVAAPNQEPKTSKPKMTRQDITAKIASDLKCSETNVDAVISSFIVQLSMAIQEDTPIQIAGFGLFKPRRPKMGRCHAPRNGMSVKPSGRKSMCFKPAAHFKNAINK